MKAWKAIIIILIILLAFFSKGTLLLYFVLPVVIAFASFVGDLDQAGSGLSPSIGSIVFFFFPSIITFLILTKNTRLGVGKLWLYSYIIASIIYYIAMEAEMTQYPRLF